MIDFPRIRLLQRQEEKLRWMILRAEARATRTTRTLTGMPRGGGAGKGMEDQIIMIATLKEQYIEVFEELNGMKAELRKMLKYIRNPYHNLAVQMRYIHGDKIRTICETMNYSDRQVVRFLRQGEQEVMKRIKP